ncbi:restriction endonuclease subunit S [Helicobacter cinaedi]|uniref:restriction endonuclease subunit S n=2 Tax=Helicobacter cinaedi TaxID=213 RepID=UPI0038B35464
MLMNLSGGGSRDFITSLLDSIQELESKLDFDLLTSCINSAPCHTERELVSTNTESNPVILSNSEKSKNKLDFSPFSKAQNDNLKTLLDSIPTPPPQGWDTIKLGQVCEIIRGITYDKTEQTTEKTQNIVLTADNITLNNTFELSKMIYLKQDFIGDKNKILRKNDIFMCFSSGSLKHIGKVAFIDKDTEYYAGGFMGILRSRFNAKFVFYTIANDDFKQKLENSATGSNINNLSGKINDLKIPLPPLEAQEKIISVVEKIESTISLLECHKPESKNSEILQHFLQG